MITGEQKKEILGLYRDGLNPYKIAKMYNVCRTTIIYHIKNQHKPVIFRKTKGGSKGVRLSRESKESAIKEARAIRSKVVKAYSDYLNQMVELQRDEKGNIIGKKPLEGV